MNMSLGSPVHAVTASTPHATSREMVAAIVRLITTSLSLTENRASAEAQLAYDNVNFNAPVRDSICLPQDLWCCKKVFITTTMWYQDPYIIDNPHDFI